MRIKQRIWGKSQSGGRIGGGEDDDDHSLSKSQIMG